MSPDGIVLCEFIDARLARASEHIAELHRDLDNLQATDRARILSSMSEDQTQVHINIGYRKPHPNRRWGVIVGDFAHSARSALDNAVYAIALTRTDRFPLKDNNRLSFPITTDAKKWPEREAEIRTLPEDAQSIIRDAQPCFTGNYPLTQLRNFNNADKHRLPLLTAGTLEEAKFEFHKPPKGQLLRVLALKGPALTDAPLITFVFAEPQVRETDVSISLKMTYFILENDTWRDVFGVLDGILSEVQKLVERLKPFIV